MVKTMTQRSGYSLVAQVIPPFTVEDNSKEIHMNKMCTFLVSLTPDSITDQIIANCMRITKLKSILSSLGVTNLANKVLPPCIANDKIFQSAMVKVEYEEQVVNLKEYHDSLHLGKKIGHPCASQKKFDYKSWERRTTNYLEVDITKEMQVRARISLLMY